MSFTLRQLILIDLNPCKAATMIRLNLPTEPYWLELGYGVRVKVRPPSTAIAAAVRAAAARRVDALRQDLAERKRSGVPLDGLPDLDDPDVREGHLQLVTAQSYARAAIVDWEGVLAAEGDAPAAVTPQAVDDLMRIYALAVAFVSLYLQPIDVLAAEGNASRPAPNGTSAAAPDTASSAETATPPAAAESAG